MVKKNLLMVLIISLLLSCSKENVTNPVTTNEVVVKSVQTFGVITDANVIYARGLSHQTVNSSTNTTLDLKLDIYKPNNEATKRPAIILFHGGGFSSGSRTDPNIVNLANFFASRGWVAFSVSYRLYNDNGTVPDAWITYAQNNLPSNQYRELFKVYPAHRDAKAAIRWIMANAASYNIDKNYITVGGGSAGAIIANAIGITEPEDYTNEIPVSIDPTISSIQKEQPYKVHTIVDLWGSGISVDILNDIYGLQRYTNNDAPIFIAHGTTDTTVPFSLGEDLREEYIRNGVNYSFNPLQGFGHGAWNATVNGRQLENLAFDFIVAQQKLKVQ